MTHPLRLYSQGLQQARATQHSGAEVQLRLRDGTVVPLPLDRYLGSADATDEQLLSDVRGPVLDVGCGPGRHLHALAARGVFALGVDLSPVAVEVATARGTRAVVASIFDELPGGRSWRTALLLDSNIGIGGDPARLLTRIAALLHDDGELLVELAGPGESTEQMLVRIETGEKISSWFVWARVSIADIAGVARSARFAVHANFSIGGRWFARLRPDGHAR
jgi:SAM-dependent methyltransferase